MSSGRAGKALCNAWAGFDRERWPLPPYLWQLLLGLPLQEMSFLHPHPGQVFKLCFVSRRTEGCVHACAPADKDLKSIR